MMSTFTRSLTHTFHIVSCYTCGAPFGIESDLYRRAVTDAKGSVYCPACGRGTCWTESDDQKKLRQLKKQLEQKDRQIATAQRRAENLEHEKEHAENKLRSTKGVVTRLKNRAAAGLCPCCNRHFENLHRHMKSQHPEYAGPKNLKEMREANSLTQSELGHRIGVSQAHISQYECGRSVTDSVRKKIEDWMSEQEVTR